MSVSLKQLVLASPLAALALVAGCSSTPENPTPVQIIQEVEATASVRSIDRTTREILLEREDGASLELIAGPAVINFDQINVGDTLTARYIESVSVRKLAADEADTESEVALGADAAELGAKPGAAVGAGIAMTVVVNSVDVKNNTVAFTDPQGVMHAISPQRDEGKTFLKSLNVGDRVELIFIEEVAVSIE